MPNKKAKERKRNRYNKNKNLKRYGRTSNQIKKIKKKKDER